jgi:hypothetical protein
MGLTGHSLSLVSKQMRYLSGPFKGQSIAITQRRQLIAFAQILPQLPDFQKKIKYLFIHCPYPFLDVENNPRIADQFGYDYLEVPDESDWLVNRIPVNQSRIANPKDLWVKMKSWKF